VLVIVKSKLAKDLTNNKWLTLEIVQELLHNFILLIFTFEILIFRLILTQSKVTYFELKSHNQFDSLMFKWII